MLKIDMRKSDWSADGFNGIHGRRPANLFATHSSILRHCRTCSGNLVGTSIFLRLFAVILGRDAQSVPRILLQQSTNLVNKLALLLHKCRFKQDSRDKPENDGCFWRWFSTCCKFFKYPSPADKSATSPSRGEVSNSIPSYVIRGRISKVINGLRPVNLKDYRNKSGNDCRVDGTDIKHKTNILLKCLDVVRQYAVLFERRVQSSTRAKKVQVVTRQTNPTGRSMIEMLGVLAIVGVLSVGGIAGYSKAMMKFKTNQAIEQITTIVTNIKTLYAQQKNYNGLDNAAAYSMGIVTGEATSGPSYSWQSTPYIYNPFNGYISIFTDWGYGDTRFHIRSDDLPKEACIALATTDWGSSSSSGLIAVSATYGTSTAENFWAIMQDPGCSGDIYRDAVAACPGGSVVPVPMPPQYAAQACDCVGNNCSMVWYYQ